MVRAVPPRKNRPIPSGAKAARHRLSTEPGDSRPIRRTSASRRAGTKTPPGETKEIVGSFPLDARRPLPVTPAQPGTGESSSLPTNWKTQTVRLRFEAVAEKSSVWMNGVRLGDHEGGVTPFEFNVTKQLHFNARNLVAVRVEGDAKRGAGIWQGVLLLAHDEAYLSEVSLTAGGLGQLTTAITLENTSDNSGVATLEGRVIALSRPDKDVHRSEQSLSLTPGRNITTLLTSVKGKNLHPWSPEYPYPLRSSVGLSTGARCAGHPGDRFRLP